MKKQYINPSVKAVTIAPVVMLSGSDPKEKILGTSSETITGPGTFADGKENEISSGSIWGEEE